MVNVNHIMHKTTRKTDGSFDALLYVNYKKSNITRNIRSKNNQQTYESHILKLLYGEPTVLHKHLLR